MGSEINVLRGDLKNDHRASSMPSSHSKLLTLPTILTLARVASIPFLVASESLSFFLSFFFIHSYIICNSFLIHYYVAFYMDGWQGTAVTTCIFTAAAITDWLDGYIARKVTYHWLHVYLVIDSTLSSSLNTYLHSIVLQMKLKSSFGAFLDQVADKVSHSPPLITFFFFFFINYRILSS
jgi:CDP-diacylglycerol---glycerol-3-phosphate 3-phosphatidyltransferase